MAKSLKNMMGAGIGAGTATLINGTVADGLVATGSSQADALVLTNDVNVVGFVSSSTGVRLLANPQPGDEVLISNLGVNALLVYPPIGATISGGSVNAPLSLPAGAAVELIARTGSANWIALSSSSSVVAPAGLATPSLVNFSALGAAPLVLSVTDADYTAGLYGQLLIDQTSSAFSNLTQNLVFLIDGASWAALDEAIGLATPSGQYWSRFRSARDNEGGGTTVSGTDPSGAAISFLADVSAWSNTFTDTIVASAAALNTTNGVNKNSTLTVTGSPALSFSGANGNAQTSARTTIEQVSNKAQFELTVTSGATTDFAVGIDDGTANLSGTISPGYNDSTGIGVEFNIGAYITVNWNARGNQINVVNNVAGTTQNGDIFTIVYDDSAHTIEVWRTRSGTTTQMGSTVSSLPTLSHRFAFASTLNSTMAGTLNFGGSTYAKTPGAGVATIWA